MFSHWWKFGRDRFTDVDLFSDGSESAAETLSQAIRAAASQEPDADGSVLFGQLRGTVVGLRYYTGVVSIGSLVITSLLLLRGIFCIDVIRDIRKGQNNYSGRL